MVKMHSIDYDKSFLFKLKKNSANTQRTHFKSLKCNYEFQIRLATILLIYDLCIKSTGDGFTDSAQWIDNSSEESTSATQLVRTTISTQFQLPLQL